MLSNASVLKKSLLWEGVTHTLPPLDRYAPSPRTLDTIDNPRPHHEKNRHLRLSAPNSLIMAKLLSVQFYFIESTIYPIIHVKSMFNLILRTHEWL